MADRVQLESVAHLRPVEFPRESSNVLEVAVRTLLEMVQIGDRVETIRVSRERTRESTPLLETDSSFKSNLAAPRDTRTRTFARALEL